VMTEVLYRICMGARYLIRVLRDVRFFITSFGFYLRYLMPILMESTPTDADVVFITVILDCIVVYLYLLLFCLFCVVVFIFI
jgi:hypothetical protein